MMGWLGDSGIGLRFSGHRVSKISSKLATGNSKKMKSVKDEEVLEKFRQAMIREKVDFYLVSGSDPHQSEYLAGYWKARAWLSGFTGSSGLLIIGRDYAGLWTDSRYTIQAEQELKSTKYVPHETKTGILAGAIDWLLDHAHPEQTVAVDGNLFSIREVEILARRLGQKNVRLLTDLDLITPLWGDRPSLPAGSVVELPLKYAGKSRTEKINDLRTQMAQDAISYYLCSALDDIAWILNLRGNDIEFNPVFISYLLVSKERALLFVGLSKIPQSLAMLLKGEGIVILPYNEFSSYLKSIPWEKKVWISKQTTSHSVKAALDEEKVYFGKNLIAQSKAIKYSVDIGNLQKEMIKDGLALTRLFIWLENKLASGGVREYEIGRQLDSLRREQGNYFGESFSAIVGYQANGAIVHYRADPNHSAVVEAQGILLIDSGGQYLEGTTDITRTVALGKVESSAKQHFTLVLKGHINLATVRFPEGVKGMHLDVLARQSLWKYGLNYGHGTGHGVGYFLNVHEGPQGITLYPGRGDTALEPGMLTSNEPGFYLQGQYGIRIENLILCREIQETDHGTFLGFETMSLFPIDRNLIDVNLLSEEEVAWLNAYHEKVFNRLSPGLKDEERKWLADKCRNLHH